jgi:ABC-type uncharacterized transport system permease subunit
MDDWYLIASTLVFLGGFGLAVASLRSGRPHGGRLHIGLAIVGVILQSLFLKERGELHGRCPITNGAEVLVFVSWSIVLFYLILGRAFRLSLLGIFTMPMVFLFQTTALVLLAIADPGPRPSSTMDPWLELHAAMSLLAYGAFGLGAVAGVMYLVQDRQLKSHHLGKLFYRLPPIRYLVDALFRLILIGTAMLTVGIVAAFFMQQWPGVVHLAIPGAVWLLYTGLLLWQMARPLSPKRFSLWGMAAFCFALATLLVL